MTKFKSLFFLRCLVNQAASPDVSLSTYRSAERAAAGVINTYLHVARTKHWRVQVVHGICPHKLSFLRLGHAQSEFGHLAKWIWLDIHEPWLAAPWWIKVQVQATRGNNLFWLAQGREHFWESSRPMLIELKGAQVHVLHSALRKTWDLFKSSLFSVRIIEVTSHCSSIALTLLTPLVNLVINSFLLLHTPRALGFFCPSLHEHLLLVIIQIHRVPCSRQSLKFWLWCLLALRWRPRPDGNSGCCPRHCRLSTWVGDCCPCWGSRWAELPCKGRRTRRTHLTCKNRRWWRCWYCCHRRSQRHRPRAGICIAAAACFFRPWRTWSLPCKADHLRVWTHLPGRAWQQIQHTPPGPNLWSWCTWQWGRRRHARWKLPQGQWSQWHRIESIALSRRTCKGEAWRSVRWLQDSEGASEEDLTLLVGSCERSLHHWSSRLYPSLPVSVIPTNLKPFSTSSLHVSATIEIGGCSADMTYSSTWHMQLATFKNHAADRMLMNIDTLDIEMKCNNLFLILAWLTRTCLLAFFGRFRPFALASKGLRHWWSQRIDG